jgi:hypothetical protein
MTDKTLANNRSGPDKPDCWKCAYFTVSWDPAKPYACKLMGFKSRMLPSFEVKMADGHDCRGFTSKPMTQPTMTKPLELGVGGVKIPARSAHRARSTQVWEA